MGRHWGRWAILGLALAIVCCCGALAAGFALVRTTNALGDWPLGWQELSDPIHQTLNVTGPVTLSADVPVGDVIVRVGSSQQLTVDGVKHAWGISRGVGQRSLDQIKVNIRQDGNQITISTTGLENVRNVPISPRLDLTLTTPPQTTLTINAQVGKVSVDGTQGDLSIRGDVGQVIVANVRPVSKLDIQTRVAGVEVSGPISAGADYAITSDVGRILFWPPPGSAFRLDALSDVGNVQVGFPLVGQDSRQGLVSKEVRGTVGRAATGTPPTAQVYLRSRVGDIVVAPK
jgi:hypothetical protein